MCCVLTIRLSVLLTREIVECISIIVPLIKYFRVNIIFTFYIPTPLQPRRRPRLPLWPAGADAGAVHPRPDQRQPAAQAPVHAQLQRAGSAALQGAGE